MVVHGTARDVRTGGFTVTLSAATGGALIAGST